MLLVIPRSLGIANGDNARGSCELTPHNGGFMLLYTNPSAGSKCEALWTLGILHVPLFLKRTLLHLLPHEHKLR